MLTSPITYDNTFSRFASIIKLANSLQFVDSTPDIPEDPQKLAHTAAPSFRPPTFKETAHTILFIKQINVKVTPQVIQILDPIFAKVPWTNTYIHTSHDHSAAPFIQSVIWDFKLDLEFFKSDIPELLPADDDDEDEPGLSFKHACFMAPPTGCWDEEDLIDIYRSEADIDAEIVDVTRLTDNLSFRMDYDMYVSPSLSLHIAADYLLSNAAKVQYPLDMELSSVVHVHVTTLLLCKHKLSFINCGQCMRKAYNHESDLPVWMIDSGASLHFTYDIGDFVKYQSMVTPIPIWTTNNITYITRLGTIIIPVLTNKGHPYIVYLYTVYHILDITSQLWSMGALDDLMVHDNTKSITFL